MKPLTLDDADILWARMRQVYRISTPVVDVIKKPWGKRLEVATDHRAPLCPGGITLKRQRCTNIAGKRQFYRGVGVCNKHDSSNPGLGATTESLMIMAHAFSNPNKIRPTAITPQMALLEELSRTVNGVRWLDEKVATATSDTDLIMAEGEIGQFLAMRERERAHLVRVANAAVNSRAVELVQEQQNIHGSQMISMLYRLVDHLELEPGSQTRAIEFLEGELLAIDDIIDPG